MQDSTPLFPSVSLSSVLSITQIHSLYYYEFPPDMEHLGESHNFWEFLYVDKGRCLSLHQGKDVPMETGEAVLIAPNDFHRLHGNGEDIFNVFIISFTCKSKAIEAAPTSKLKISRSTHDLISRIIKESRKAFRLPIFDHFTPEIIPQEHPPFGSRQLIKLYLEELLITLLREEGTDKNDPILSILSSSTADPKDLVESVEKYLLDNIDKNLTIPFICETFHYSKNHICSHFKEKTGYSIMEYFNRAKVERAKELMRQGDIHISSIAEKLGFSSPSYFSKTFKRITGRSPLEYQRSLEHYYK